MKARLFAVACAVLLGGVALAPFGDAAQSSSTGCNDGTVTWSPDSLWPPNHKFQTIGITYDDSDDDDTRLTVGLITHDQILADGTELNGSGHTLVDGTGTGNSDDGSGEDNATTTAQVRGERSGRDQTGRVYSIQVTCEDFLAGTNRMVHDGTGTDSNGDPNLDGTETVTLTVFVPHDLGNHTGQQ